MFKFTDYIKRDGVQRTIYFLIHLIEDFNEKGLSIIDYNAGETLNEFEVEAILDEFDLDNISSEKIKELIRSELCKYKIANKKLFLSNANKVSEIIPANSSIIKLVTDEVKSDFATTKSCDNIVNDKYIIIGNNFPTIMPYIYILLDKHIKRLNTQLNLNFNNVIIDLNVGSEMSSNIHNISYSGYTEGNIDLTELKIVLHPKEIYYQVLGGNTFPFDILAFERSFVSTLAHEYRHIWQLYNNFNFSQPDVDYICRNEEIDAIAFAKEYTSRYFDDISVAKKYLVEYSNVEDFEF